MFNYYHVRLISVINSNLIVFLNEIIYGTHTQFVASVEIIKVRLLWIDRFEQRLPICQKLIPNNFLHKFFHYSKYHKVSKNSTGIPQS